MKHWLLLAALAVTATAAFAPPAHAHIAFPDHITCDVNNGVGCINGFARWTSTHSHMHTIPSAINYICANAQNRDGSWKNAGRCFSWSSTHRANVYYETFTESRYAGWWRGGGAPNWILVEAGRLYPA